MDNFPESKRELGLDYEPVGEAYLCDKCHTPFDGAWECPSCGHRSATKEPVYTTPPAAQRQWVGLTDEEIDDCIDQEDYLPYATCKAIEAKLREKNT